MDARLQYLTTSDNLKLYYELWMPDKPKAVVVFVHGLGDHLGRYASFAKFLIANGYGVCLYDQRGHGRSTGRRMHCRSFGDYLKDLSQVIELVQDIRPNAPLFLAGHSFGGQVAINFVTKYSKGLRGVVALSPNIEPLVAIPGWKKKFALKLSAVIPIVKFKSWVDPKDFSHDLQVVERAKADPLMHWHVTARLGAEILKNLDGIKMQAFQVKIPALFMHGGDDKITSIEATRKFYHHLLVQNKDLKTYPGMYHELLNESGREKIYHDIDVWINGQLEAYSRLARSGGEEGYEKKNNLNLWHNSRTDFGMHGRAI
jgi:alpha-beta hydrolase superfamily lysophospholipase